MTALSAPLSSHDIHAWLDFILSLHHQEVDLGLSRISAIAHSLGLTQFDHTKVITVAGTNGKGSTCAYMEHALLANGYSVAVYSSPHFIRYNERLRVNQGELVDAEHIEAFKAINEGRADKPLSFFEFATLAALWLVKKHQPDVLLLEVGLGGRLDATNIVQADVNVITSIGLDHTELLGDTREKIGFEKAGIFKHQVPAVMGDLDCPQSVIKQAQEVDCPLFIQGREFALSTEGDKVHFQFEGESMPLNMPKLPLINMSTALVALRQLGLPMADDKTASALAQASLPGRMERVANAPDVILDVAHNPHAARYLAANLQKTEGNIVAICGMLRDKDSFGVFSELQKKINEWHFIDLPTERAASAQQLQQTLHSVAPNAPSHCYSDIWQAYNAIYPQLNKADTLLIFGSFYTVAEYKSKK